MNYILKSITLIILIIAIVFSNFLCWEMIFNTSKTVYGMEWWAVSLFFISGFIHVIAIIILIYFLAEVKK